MQIENFMWDEYRHVHRYSAEISHILSEMPEKEVLLDYLIENTDFELYLMDAQEYAEEPKRKELRRKGLIFTKDIMREDPSLKRSSWPASMRFFFDVGLAWEVFME